MKVWIGYSDGRYSFSTELKIGMEVDVPEAVVGLWTEISRLDSFMQKQLKDLDNEAYELKEKAREQANEE